MEGRPLAVSLVGGVGDGLRGALYKACRAADLIRRGRRRMGKWGHTT